MFKNILLATDFSDSSRAALFAAIHLGSQSLGKIHALHVVTYAEDIFRGTRYPVPDSKWREAIQLRLNEFFPKSLYPNSRRYTLFGGAVADEIMNFAMFHKCELIVTGTHGRRALGRLLLGSVTSSLIRSSQVPVMVVREAEKSPARYQGFDRILVPIDFSDTSVRALDFAIQFARFLQSEIHLLHVIDLPAIKGLQQTYRVPGLFVPDASELNVDLTLQKMLDKYEPFPKTNVKTSYGDPPTEILKYAADHNCNFIVMGSHGRKGLGRTLLGSVVTTVSANAGIPVMTIPNKETIYNKKTVEGTFTQLDMEWTKQL